MRGAMIASVLCVVMCLHYADAQWPSWVLSKGKTCEDRCKTKLKMCKPADEFMDCKCIPQQLKQNYLKYATLPIDSAVLCLMSSPKVPKCCSIYNKQKDAFKSSDSDMASKLRNQSQEIQQLKDRLGSEETIAELETKLASQQNELEELKTKLDAEQTENEELKTKLGAEQDQNENPKVSVGTGTQDDTVSMSNLTADMFHTLGEKNRIQDAGMQQLKENLSNLSAVMSSTIQQLEKKLQSVTASMSIMLLEQNKESGNVTQAWSGEAWKKLAGSNPIGFSATAPVWLGDGHGVALGFATVRSNEGGAFNQNTGIFTCPEAGMYYFIMHLTKKRSSKVDAGYGYIKRNGESVAEVYTDPQEGTADNGNYGDSGSVFIKLNVGDRVQLADCSVRGSLEPWSSFTGFLVAQ